MLNGICRRLCVVALSGSNSLVIDRVACPDPRPLQQESKANKQYTTFRKLEQMVRQGEALAPRCDFLDDDTRQRMWAVFHIPRRFVDSWIDRLLLHHLSHPPCSSRPYGYIDMIVSHTSPLAPFARMFYHASYSSLVDLQTIPSNPPAQRPPLHPNARYVAALGGDSPRPRHHHHPTSQFRLILVTIYCSTLIFLYRLYVSCLMHHLFV